MHRLGQVGCSGCVDNGGAVLLGLPSLARYPDALPSARQRID